MKEILESCFGEALRALDPYWLVKDNLHLEKERLYWGSSFLIDLKDYRRVLLAGLGIAAPSLPSNLKEEGLAILLTTAGLSPRNAVLK